MKRRAEEEDDDQEEWPKRKEINRAEEQDDREERLGLSLSSSGYKPKPPSTARSVPIQPTPLMSSMSALSPQAPSQETFFAVPPHHLPSSRLSGVLPLKAANRLPSQEDQDQDQDQAIPSRPAHGRKLMDQALKQEEIEIITPPPSQEDQDQDQAIPSRPPRARKLMAQALKPGKSETIKPPYPWTTSRRATVYSLQYLLDKGMNVIIGAVQCRFCKEDFEVEYDLQEKFVEVAEFLRKNKHSMHERAPSVWMNPVLPNCELCGKENCAKPVITKKKLINWLFLLLGQMLGCCNVEQLKYFCKHTMIWFDKVATKDRLLFLTYLGLCKQVDSKGFFDI